METDFQDVKTLTSVLYPIMNISEIAVGAVLDSVLERPDPTANPVTAESVENVGIGLSYEDVMTRGTPKELFEENVGVSLSYEDILSPSFHSEDLVGSIGVGFSYDDILIMTPPVSNLEDSVGVGFVYDNVIFGS